MEKGIDLKVNELKNKIVEDINSEELPAVLVKYILMELLEDAKNLEKDMIQKEREDYDKSKKTQNDVAQKENGRGKINEKK